MMQPEELAAFIYQRIKAQEREGGPGAYVGDDTLLSHVIIDGPADLIKLAAEIIAATLEPASAELVGIVMKNSGGSANPATVEKVIMALRGERVSFVGTPVEPKITARMIAEISSAVDTDPAIPAGDREWRKGYKQACSDIIAKLFARS